MAPEAFEDGRGISFYVNKNPINDLFTFSLRVETGTRENELAAIAQALEDALRGQGVQAGVSAQARFPVPVPDG